MVIIKKVLNSSVVLVEDDEKQEFILLGKGIGFDRKPGFIIENIEETQAFIPIQNQQNQKFVEILSDIPYDLLCVTKDITDVAKRYLATELNASLYFLLADHLAFAIEREKNHLHIPNRLFWEIKSFYPDEFEVGLQSIALIRKHLNIELPEEEAANIAFHIVNARVGERKAYDAAKYAKLIGEILKIIQYSLGKAIDKENINYIRLVIHIKFFAERFFEDKMLNNDHPILLQHLKTKYPEELKIAKNIATFVSNKYQVALTTEEITFLALHVNRIKNSLAI